ncbi:hypothetical protein Vretimale_9393 [Volvox reticuliferus]|uniref:Uncharacterized protein n=1 Tax=Volvox reticuliferus TaxID=1737510 RepID=A0A8J4CIM6_9CHLO|nr:hypothetical protein Vretifemale_9881 [Volvox reticuliferus]GIM04890.1 hypothetical protein Vretimale_9393 [Volvox reticuliferus]
MKANRHQRHVATHKRKADWEPGDETPSGSGAENPIISGLNGAQLSRTQAVPERFLVLKDSVLRDLEEQSMGPSRAFMDTEVGHALQGFELTLGSDEVIRLHLVGHNENDMRKVIKALVKRCVGGALKVPLSKLHNAICYKVCREVEGASRQFEHIVAKAYRIAIITESQQGPLLVNPAPMVVGVKEAFQTIKIEAKMGAGNDWTKGLAKLLCATDWASKAVETCERIQLPEFADGASIWAWYVEELRARYFAMNDFSSFTVKELQDNRYPALVSVKRVVAAAQGAYDGLERLAQQQRMEKALGRQPWPGHAQQHTAMPPPGGG